MKPDTLTNLQRQADLCVKCGLCLPTCPTYVAEQSEAQSPRGRIAIIQGIAAGQLESSAGLLAPIEDCLSCGECERVCPANVPYTEMQTTALLALAKPRPIAGRFWLTARSIWLTRASLVVKAVFSASIWRRVMPRTWMKLRALPRSAPARTKPAVLDVASAPIGLHLGCVSQNFDTETTNAAISVLQAAGLPFSIPAAQQCCGAVYAHHQHADALANATTANAKAFAGQTAVSCASGCAAQLRSNASGDNDATDIVSYLLESLPSTPLKFAPLPRKVFVQEPCTLRNELQGGGRIKALLALLPGIEVVQPTQLCCGASGTHFMSAPDDAAKHAAPLVEQIKDANPDIVVSANIGCAMHLRGQLAAAKIHVDVVHPVVLLAACVN